MQLNSGMITAYNLPVGLLGFLITLRSGLQLFFVIFDNKSRLASVVFGNVR